MQNFIAQKHNPDQNQFLKIVPRQNNIDYNNHLNSASNVSYNESINHLNEDLMTALKQINKLKITSNSSSSSGASLESQLSQLSKAYNSVQTKLLQTQKLLYMESLLSQKQRSIIQLLKYILSTNNQQNYEQDYESIVTFISKIQSQNSSSKQGKNIVKIELDDIKRIIQQNKIKRMREGKQIDQIRSLKLQLNKMMQHSLTLQQTFCQINDDNYELKQSIKQKENQILNLRDHIKKEQEKQNIFKEEILNKAKKQVEKTAQKQKILQTQKNLIKCYQSTFLKISQMISHFIPKQSQRQNDKLQSNNNKEFDLSSYKNQEFTLNKESQLQPLKVVEIIRKILNKSLSNRQQLKICKNKLKNQQFLENEVRLLKSFISEEGLSIIREYELTQGKEKCLEEQIKNYSKIQRQKMYQLEQCQLQMWRIKNKMLKQQNCEKKRFFAVNTAHQSPYLEKLFSQNLSNTRFKSSFSKTQFKESIQIKDFKQLQEDQT